MRDANVTILRDLDFTSAVQPYLESPIQMTRLNALATLASIVDEKESEIINANQRSVELLLQCLEKGSENPLRRHNRWSCKESAFSKFECFLCPVCIYNSHDALNGCPI